jgi:hypothetical protein
MAEWIFHLRLKAPARRVVFIYLATADQSNSPQFDDKTAIQLIGPNGKPVKGAQIPSSTGEDFSSLGRKQAVLDHYYTRKRCGKGFRQASVGMRESPLIQAVRAQDLPKLSKMASRKKWSANGTDRCGMTAVQNAILEGNTPMILFLIEHHANLHKTNREHQDSCALLRRIDDQNLSRFLDLCK